MLLRTKIIAAAIAGTVAAGAGITALEVNFKGEPANFSNVKTQIGHAITNLTQANEVIVDLNKTIQNLNSKMDPNSQQNKSENDKKLQKDYEQNNQSDIANDSKGMSEYHKAYDYEVSQVQQANDFVDDWNKNITSQIQGLTTENTNLSTEIVSVAKANNLTIKGLNTSDDGKVK